MNFIRKLLSNFLQKKFKENEIFSRIVRKIYF